MRKLLLIIIFLFLFISLSTGQSYHKFINGDLYWDVAYAEMGYICGAFSDYGPWRYSFDGDTMINDMLYSKFIGYEHFSASHPSPPKCEPFYVDPDFISRPNYFMREDTINRKVYRYDGYNELDQLLYDFNAKQGDTIVYPWFDNFIVDTIFEITTNDGVHRNYYETFSGLGGFYIEGIGGVGGPFGEPFHYFEAGGWLMCVKDHQSQVIWGTNCYDFTTRISNPLLSENFFRIYPCPAKSFVIIKTLVTPGQNAVLDILDISGQQILSRSLKESKTKIDISHLPAGVYIVKVQSKNALFTQKLLVN